MIEPYRVNKCLLVTLSFLVVGCASENDHFCAKYSFYYKELTAPGILPYRDIKAQLEADLRKDNIDHDKTKMALFVLEEIDNDVKPAAEAAQDFCLRRERWKVYR